MQYLNIVTRDPCPIGSNPKATISVIENRPILRSHYFATETTAPEEPRAQSATRVVTVVAIPYLDFLAKTWSFYVEFGRLLLRG